MTNTAADMVSTARSRIRIRENAAAASNFRRQRQGGCSGYFLIIRCHLYMKSIRHWNSILKRSIKKDLVIVVIMCLMSNVVNFAMSIMGESTPAENAQEAQADFYSYLYVLASYNEMSGAALSYEDFADADDRSAYEQVFEMMNAQADLELSVEGFGEAADALSEGDISLDTYVHQFEYTYALGNIKGCFTGGKI